MSAADTQDEAFMLRALGMARMAADRGEVPVGAVLIDAEGHVLAEAGNAPIENRDPSAHAEILTLRAAGRKLDNYRMPGTTMFVTLEPCPMCATALVHARVARVVFAAADPKTGSCGSVLDLTDDPRLNHRLQVTRGVLAESAAGLLKEFFGARR
jgi:tRNA(adenine34) deaminase